MSKVLEKIVFKRLYEYLTENRLLTDKNSGFKKNDSTTNQLLKIVHQIYQDINEGKDTCMVFLDVSKAFDKVWHTGLIFKLQKMCIRGNLLKWLKDYIRLYIWTSPKGCSKWCGIKSMLFRSRGTSGVHFRTSLVFDIYQ